MSEFLPEIVVVAAIIRDRENRLCLSRRPEHKHQGGLWEFPGGKREANETIERCLHRELKEELGIEVALGQALESVTHKYSVKTVQITFFLARLAKEGVRFSNMFVTTSICAASRATIREALKELEESDV